MTGALTELAAEWRSEADTLRRRGAEAQATALESAADDLDSAWQSWRRERLTVEEAADASGYSEAHLRRLIRDGKLPNAGEEHRPLVRRVDLPKKPGSGTQVAVAIDSDGALGSETWTDGSVADLNGR